MNAPFYQHIHVSCSDIKAMAAFWVEGFGARLEGFRKFGVLEGAVLDINSGQTKLYLREQPCERQDATAVRSGVDHLGMAVPDLDKALAALTALPGVALAKEPFMSQNARCAFITGPEGISVELVQEHC